MKRFRKVVPMGLAICLAAGMYTSEAAAAEENEPYEVVIVEGGRKLS